MNSITGNTPKSQSSDIHSRISPDGFSLPVILRREGESPFLVYNSNNCIEEDSQEARIEVITALVDFLTPYHKKQAETLFLNVSRLIAAAPTIDHVGFLTLTFPDNVTDSKEALSRFRSMNTNFFSSWPEIREWICVKEVQSRGAWHYHLLAIFAQDIRTGLDFDQVAQGQYSSASSYLRSLWATLRDRLPAYGFGRSELLPIKSNAEGMARYIGKYVGKLFGWGQRPEKLRGVRLVSYSQGWVKNSPKFQWHTDGAKEWRRKLRVFANMNHCEDFYDLTKKLGPAWAYNYATTIRDIDDLVARASADVPF